MSEMGIQSTPQTHRVFAVFSLALFCLPAANAQITFGKRVGDKTIMCQRSGLTSDLKDCGARADWYTYVFVGLITAITPVKHDEKEIRIVPREIFRGTPPSSLTVVTSQGLCLPKLAAGDQWLFFLRKNKDDEIVLDFYGNDSLPVADARSQIETLRRLQNIGKFGIVRGKVLRGPSFDEAAVPGAKLIAHRVSDGLQFFSTTGPDGNYQFRPLPAGEYEVTVNPIGSFKPDGGGVDVSGGDCWDFTFTRHPHAQIGGSVRRSDGSPVPNVGVVLIRLDDSFETTKTDANGRFVFDSQEPEEFVVGVNYPARPDWFYGSGGGRGARTPPASWFYRGAANRSSARVIRLAADQKLSNIDFVLPAR